MTRLKVCGITNIEDALVSAEFGADALGFVFYERSKRYIDPMKAGEIIRSLPPFILKVGVFVNESISDLLEAQRVAGFDMFQLHGNETSEYCSNLGRPYIKALRVKTGIDKNIVNSFNTRSFLFDTYSDNEFGGTGKRFNWDILENAGLSDKFVILSGGLEVANVGRAIRKVRPYAVDVSSGVEKSPGVKDHYKLKAFAEAVRNESQV